MSPHINTAPPGEGRGPETGPAEGWDDPLDTGLRRYERKILKFHAFPPLPPGVGRGPGTGLLRFGNDPLASAGMSGWC